MRFQAPLVSVHPFTALALALALAAPGCGSVRDTTTPDAATPDDAPLDPGAPDTTLTVTPAVLGNQTEARFEFESTLPDSTFTCKVDDASAVACTSPFVTTVAEGEHAIEVTAVSSSGMPDPSPATFAWTVDVTPPVTTISQAPPQVDNSTSVTIEFTASEPATFRCTVDGGAPMTCSSPLSLSDLADGAHSVSITAIDEAGNEELEPVSHGWLLDSTPPDTSITGGPTGYDKTTTATFTFTSPDAGAGATFSCALDAGSFAPCTSPRMLTGLAQGQHTFFVRVTDAGGNTDPTPAQRTWTVDSIAPVVAITSGPSGATRDTQPSFAFTVTDATPTTIQCRVDSGAFAACTSPFTVPSALADGSHSIEVRATDAAGNQHTVTRPFSVDTTPPSVSITSGPSNPTNDNTPTFTFSTGDATSVSCRIGTAAFAPCTSPYTVSPALADGAYTFEVRATDAVGNAASASRTFTVDVTPPIVTVMTKQVAYAGTTHTVTFTVSGHTTFGCRVYWSGGTKGGFTACSSPWSVYISANPPMPPLSFLNAEVRAVDAAGNETIRGVAIAVCSSPTDPNCAS